MPLPPEGSYYVHGAVMQNGDTLYNGEPYPVGGDDELLVILKFLARSYTGLRINNGELIRQSYTEVTSDTELASRNIWVSFSGIKEHASFALSNDNWSKYRLMDDCLSDMGVPEAEHQVCFDKLFQVVAAEAVSHHRPIVVAVWHVTYNTTVPALIPASGSAIESLERMRLDREIIGHMPSCVICLVDFATQDVDQLVITLMPCSHYYHGNCIVQWLHISHLCPLCRYPMPVDFRSATD